MSGLSKQSGKICKGEDKEGGWKKVKAGHYSNSIQKGGGGEEEQILHHVKSHYLN